MEYSKKVVKNVMAQFLKLVFSSFLGTRILHICSPLKCLLYFFSSHTEQRTTSDVDQNVESGAPSGEQSVRYLPNGNVGCIVTKQRLMLNAIKYTRI